jgi:ribonuclease HII
MPPDERAIRGVDDSKRVAPDARPGLAARIRERALAVAVGAASVREIDRLNIYHATVLAMRRALRRLGVAPHHVIVDGKAMRTLEIPHTAVVGGDGCCYSIACASIVAKVTRDRVMRALAARHPLYRWEHNVGYCTRAHLDGIAAHGVTPHHRRSFLPVRQLTLDFSGAALPGEIDVDALMHLVQVDTMLPALDDVLGYTASSFESVVDTVHLADSACDETIENSAPLAPARSNDLPLDC